MEDTVLDIVMWAIVELFPTPDVEQKLSPEADLREDLKLSDEEIVMICLKVECHYQVELNNELIHIPDSIMLGCKTVQDISDSFEKLLSNEQ